MNKYSGTRSNFQIYWKSNAVQQLEYIFKFRRKLQAQKYFCLKWNLLVVLLPPPPNICSVKTVGNSSLT